MATQPNNISETSVDASPKRRESFESIVRRFLRDTQQNRILTEIKKRTRGEQKISRDRRRRNAIAKAARKRVRRGY